MNWRLFFQKQEKLMGAQIRSKGRSDCWGPGASLDTKIGQNDMSYFSCHMCQLTPNVYCCQMMHKTSIIRHKEIRLMVRGLKKRYDLSSSLPTLFSTLNKQVHTLSDFYCMSIKYINFWHRNPVLQERQFNELWQELSRVRMRLKDEQRRKDSLYHRIYNDRYLEHKQCCCKFSI
jgi:hypothetical protein